MPWSELDDKQNSDEMWECWKSLFVQVLDKHAPLKTKRVRKRGSVYLGLIRKSGQSYSKKNF